MGSPFSIAAKKQYMDENGDKCPFCHTSLLVLPDGPFVVSDVSVFPKTITRSMACHADGCLKKWCEIYKLNDIEGKMVTEIV